MPLGGPRLRTLFSLLALRAPGVVSRDALIDGVWDAHPPACAAKTLRAHIAYLRQGFATRGLGALIGTRAPGYALAVPAGSVDVHRFEAAVRDGETAAGAGDLATAVTRWRDALRLWRGDVLADCPAGDWARAEVARLGELRLFATERLLSAELTLGRHAAVTAELESLVALHPLRERLWELLMRALFRSGRRGDALAAYRRARAHLIEELGVEPGPELRRLEALVLADDGGPPVTVTPRRPSAALPQPLTALIGRDTELSEVAGLLRTRRLVTLTGPGGCGKTRLALAAAHLESSARTGFVDLAPVRDPALVPAAVAASLGVAEDPSAGAVEALAQHLSGRPWLLVLDNCEHLVEACATLAETLLRSCAALRVLATSREALGVPGEAAFAVPLLAVPPPGQVTTLAESRRYDAVRLLLERSAVTAVRDLTDADACALTAICHALDGLPLAIELAAARTTMLTFAEIAARVHDPALLPARRSPHHRALDDCIRWSHDLLDPAAQARFRQLAVFTGGFTLDAAAAVWALPHPLDLLGDLVGKSLIVADRHPSGTRYRLLETIRRWAADRLAAHPAEEADARTRHAAHYTALACEAEPSLRGPDTAHWLDRLSAEHENLRAALTWYARSGDPATELRLAVALAPYCRLRGRYSEGRHWLESALTHHPDHSSPSHQPDGTYHPGLRRQPDDSSGSHYQIESAVIHHPGLWPQPDSLSNHRPEYAGTHHSLDTSAVTARTPTLNEGVASTGDLGAALAAAAQFAYLVGDYGDADGYAERALAAHRAHADTTGVARALRLLGSIARERAQYQRSLSHLDEALTLTRDNPAAAADVRQLTAFTCWLAGHLDRAEHLLHQALTHYESTADAVSTASSHLHLAAVAHYRSQPAAARHLAQTALTTFHALDVKEGIAWTNNILGLIELSESNPHKALTALTSSLELHLAVGDRWRQASVLDALATTLLHLDAEPQATHLAALATSLRHTIGTPVPTIEQSAWHRLHDHLPATTLPRATSTTIRATLAESATSLTTSQANA